MTSKQFRLIARNDLAGKWLSAILAAAAAFLLGGIIVGSNFLPQAKYTIRSLNMESPSALLYDLQNQLPKSFGFSSTLSGALGLLGFIIGGVVELGYAKYLLMLRDGQQPQTSVLFDYFDVFATGFLQAFLRKLYVFLWGLLLIIPGIVAHYRYAMTPFILAERPDLSPSQAIRLSSSMMEGYKWQLFCLDFSFIGWMILSALTLNLGHLALNPYMGQSHAVFYRYLRSRQ